MGVAVKAWITHGTAAALVAPHYLVMVAPHLGGYAFSVVCNNRQASGLLAGSTMLEAKREAVKVLRDMLQAAKRG